MKAVYIRTSTDEQNPVDQLRDIKPDPEAQIFKEMQSAWKDGLRARPEFTKLRRMIMKGQIQELHVWDLDRLYRNRRRLVSLFKLCQTQGCRIISYRQPWLNEISSMPDPWGEIVESLMIQIMGWMAEEESEKKSDRVKKKVVRTDAGTFSTDGKKWGRKAKEIDISYLLQCYKATGSYRKAAAMYNQDRTKKQQISYVKAGEIIKNA